jgi:hypothetical protein
LPENGGHLIISQAWAYSILKRLNYVKRKGTKAAKKIPTDFDSIKENFLARISTTIEQHRIPKELCVNVDETGANYIPVAGWTVEEEGAAQVPIAAFEDKRQMTVVLAVSATGSVLPPQVIYEGKTEDCHPKNVVFPSEWGITHTESHWSTEKSILLYVNSVLDPYFNKQKKKLGLPASQKSLLLWDVYASHRTKAVLDLLIEKNIQVIFIPACCTGELQPLDLTVNSVFKRLQRDAFSNWYALDLKNKLDAGENIADVKMCLRLSIVKPLHAEWLKQTISSLESKEEIVEQGFRLAGILQCFKNNFADTLSLQQLDFNDAVPIATQAELSLAEEMGHDSIEYDSSDDELTIIEFLKKKNT